MKHILISLIAITFYITSYAQAENYVPHVVTGSLFSDYLYSNLPNHTSEDINICHIAKNDTLVVISILKEKDRIFVECFVDGKVGYLSSFGTTLGVSEFDKFSKKYSKELKKDRDSRIELAKEYENIKRNQNPSVGNKVVVCTYRNKRGSTPIELTTYDLLGNPIGAIKMDSDNQFIVLYSVSTLVHPKGLYYYKAFYDGKFMLVSSEDLTNFTDYRNNRYTSDLIRLRYIGEDIRKDMVKQAVIKTAEDIDNEKKELEERIAKTKEEVSKRIEEKRKKQEQEEQVENKIKIDRTLEPISTETNGLMSRANAVLPKLSAQPVSQLLSAKGWGIVEGGQWLSRQNRIPYSTIERAYSSLGADNFTSLKIYSMKYGDKDYLVLVKSYKDGFFEYDIIKEGWTPANSYEYYVFKVKDLDLFKDIKDGEISILQIPILAYEQVLYSTPSIPAIEKKIIDKINEKPSAIANYYNLNFMIITDKLKNKVQFFMSNSHYSSLFNMKEQNVPSLEELKKGYYEVDYTIFSKFIKLP